MKKILVSLIVILLVVSVAYTTYATDGGSSILNEIENMIEDENGKIEEDGNVEQIPEGTENKEELNTNTNVPENRPETTPHAGLEDYTGLVFVAIFAVSAVYAYKKMKY